MGKNPITIEVLETLDAIDRRGSFAKAAEELNKATSAISYSVQKLEEQLFFLTSRNAGAHAALMACRQIDPEAAHWVVVEVTAKAKVCVSNGAPCEPENCPRALGYYDRVNPAVDALLAQRFADRATIELVAQKYQVCPFELALDLALWADVIVGDYNYVFDPVVRLKRFAEHRQLQLL